MSELHMMIFSTQGLEPIIFMRVLRVALLAMAGVLMLFEPMQCGGKNRPFHLMLAFFLFAGSWISWSQAQARMLLVATDPLFFFATVPPGRLFWPELLFTAAGMLLTGRLLYDVYVFQRLKRFGLKLDCGRECDLIKKGRPAS